jgi:hypothetical protein
MTIRVNIHSPSLRKFTGDQEVVKANGEAGGYGRDGHFSGKSGLGFPNGCGHPCRRRICREGVNLSTPKPKGGACSRFTLSRAFFPTLKGGVSHGRTGERAVGHSFSSRVKPEGMFYNGS